MEKFSIYIRMKKKIEATLHTKILLKDIAHISTNSLQKDQIVNIPVYKITKKDDKYVVIDSYHLIQYLNSMYPHLDIQIVGLTETIVQVNNKRRKSSILLFCFAWIILFVGTAMTIMNFHYDVSMQEVQQRFHFLLTGEQVKYPLWIQIPYSFGLGIGMIIFLNHWFHKRINEEPSPLELELFNYQRNVDDYITYFENDVNDEQRHF